MRSLLKLVALSMAVLCPSFSQADFDRDSPAFADGKTIGHFRGVLAQGSYCAIAYPKLADSIDETLNSYMLVHSSAYLEAYRSIFSSYSDERAMLTDIEGMLERVNRMESEYLSFSRGTAEAEALCLEYAESPESIIGVSP